MHPYRQIAKPSVYIMTADNSTSKSAISRINYTTLKTEPSVIKHKTILKSPIKNLTSHELQ